MRERRRYLLLGLDGVFLFELYAHAQRILNFVEFPIELIGIDLQQYDE